MAKWTPEMKRAYMAEWRKANKDRAKAYQREYVRRPESKARSAALRQEKARTDPAYVENLRQKNNDWYHRNSEKVLAAEAKRRRADPRHYKNKTLRMTYGIGIEDFDRMKAEQDEACAICRNPFSDIPGPNGLHVDHCHTTGAVRGLLCSKCNTGLGKFRDTPEYLRAAADYLDKSRAR